MEYLILCDEIYTQEMVLKGYVKVKDGKIQSITEQPEENLEIVDLRGLRLFAGLIDIHVHGGNGVDTMDATYEALNELSKFKIQEGVTSFCPTTVTASREKTDNAILNVYEAQQKGVEGAKIIGTFLEGPFICPEYKGAHPLQYIQDIDLNEIQRLIDLGRGTVKSIAIAPEITGGQEAVQYITKRGINVRIGHSAATYEDVFEAIDHGANIAIHTYNAMTGLNHRKPGMVGAVMVRDDIYAELICDLVHVNPVAMEVLVRCKGDHLILVTDCMAAGGLGDGKFMLGELEVEVKNKIATIGNGVLAGSTLNLMTAVKNMHETVGAPLLSAVNMATINPAKALGVDKEIGSIAVGKSADLVAVDTLFNVQKVIVGGEFRLK